jgi:mannose-6-phosphate isomerase
VWRLDGRIRPYAWGSHTAVARIQGRPAPTDRPEAELWLGAHPSAPSTVDGLPLTTFLARDPTGLLGPSTVERFGPRLPYLFKLLAADQPLSLQAHPDATQAAAGYAAEEAAGIPRDAPGRNYADPYHKPELLVAIEGFDALCGFRSPPESADLLAALGVPALKSTVDHLRQPDPAAALRGAVHGLLTLPVAQRRPLVNAVAASGHPLAADLAARYPGDVGVVVALLLNQVRLAPGEAVWMPAGNLHAYLSGVGMEIMAASDNVLRGGLTPKHVDVDELLRILRFEVLADPVVRARPAGPGLWTWPAPVAEFALYRAAVAAPGAPVVVPGDGPRIVFCLRGEVLLDDGVAAVRLCGGQAAFGAAGAIPVTVSGTGEVFQATTAPARPGRAPTA